MERPWVSIEELPLDVVEAYLAPLGEDYEPHDTVPVPPPAFDDDRIVW